MQKICIDMSALSQAWRDESPDNLYYLDTLSGVVKLVHKHLFDLRELTDEIEKNRERFLYVPKLDRGIEIKELHAFKDLLEKPELVRILDMAFESPHVLTSFKKILETHPEELAMLETYRARLLQARINEWLSANDYEHDPEHVNQFDRDDDFQDNDDSDDEKTSEDYEDEERIRGRSDFSPGR